MIVTYEDWYKWDLTQYLWTLDICFKNAEMYPFAHANFYHDGLHKWPDRREEVQKLIDQIMMKLEALPKE